MRAGRAGAGAGPGLGRGVGRDAGRRARVPAGHGRTAGVRGVAGMAADVRLGGAAEHGPARGRPRRPGGGLLGRLVADALPAVLDERWVELWRGAGVSRARISGAALRRVLPPLVPQFGMVAVGLTGGAVAVETVFAVPGIGRTALGAAKSQDLPLLQGSVLALLALGPGHGRAGGVSPGGGCWARPCATPAGRCLRPGRCAHIPRCRCRCSPSSP